MHLEGLVLQGAGGQAPLDGEAAGADGHRHGRALLPQGEVKSAEETRKTGNGTQ